MISLTEWIGADGTTLALDGTAGIKVQRGVAGLDSPPIMNTLDQRVTTHGSIRTHSHRPERQITLPLMFETASLSMATLARTFQAGPGTLVASSGRQLRSVIYNGGLEAAWTVDTGGVEGLTFRKVTLDLLALDPWWYGEWEEVNVTPLSAATAWDAAISWDAVLPWDGGSTVTVVVEGDASASPVVQPYFDIEGFVLSNGLMGWTMARDIDTTETITIDSRPGYRGARTGNEFTGDTLGPFDWTLLTEDSRLFDLPVGTSSLVYSVTSSAATSGFYIRWEPRWLTP